MLRTEAALDLTRRFGEFADTSSRFSKEVVRHTPEFSQLTRSDNVHLNLEIARIVFSKWSVDIVSLLYISRTAGFQEIRKELGRITNRVLSTKLARLEEMGIIKRDVLTTRPPRVMYSLTEKGLRASKLGEPLFLYLRLTEGLLVDRLDDGPRRRRAGSRSGAKASTR